MQGGGAAVAVVVVGVEGEARRVWCRAVGLTSRLRRE